MIHVNITVTGKVQKVGFRFMAMQTASQLGVAGIVMNLDNDKVYIEAEGPEDKVEQFTKWCHTGPPWSKVTDIKITRSEVRHYVKFDIVNTKK